MTATEHPISTAVAFPTSNPDDEARAHVELGASLDDVPTWSLDGKQARALEGGIERVLETFYPE